MKKIILFAFCCAGPVVAQADQNLRPASFNHEESKKRLISRIEFPAVKGNANAMISCYSQIAKSGKMNETGCFSRDNFDGPFAAAIMKAAKKSSMTPAIIGGKKRKVYVQFRIEFIAKGEDRNIYAYANPGNAENIEAYGYEFVAPQRAVGSEAWQKVCPQRARYLLVARVFIGEDGQAGTPNLEHLGGIVPTVECQNAIRDTIQLSPYTPAVSDGSAAPSAFVETFGN